MAVELPLKTKYIQVTNGKVRTRAAGGGNSVKKHPNKNKHMQGAGLRVESNLKREAQAQTEANRRVLVISSLGRRHWLLKSQYEKLVKSGRLDDTLTREEGSCSG